MYNNSPQQEPFSAILRPALPPPNYINAYQPDVSHNRSNSTNSTNSALQNILPPILPRIAPAGPLPLPATPQSRPRPSRPKYKIKTDKTAWTADEDNLLRLAVQLYGDRSERWTKIAACVPGRTNKMCRKRWFHSLDPNLRKGPWTEEEDELLRKAVEKHNRVWCKVAEFIPGRTDDQCAKRWKECLDPDIDHTEWSTIEDNLLIAKYEEFGSQWQQIAQFFPGRPGLHCRNRWRKIQRLKKAHKDPSMDMVINIITPNDITTPSSSSSPHTSTSSLSTSLHSTPQNMHSTMQQNMQQNLQQSLQSNTSFNLSTNNVQSNVQQSNTQPHVQSRSSPIMSRQNVNLQQSHVHSNLQQQQHLQSHLLDNNPPSNLQSDSDLHSHMTSNLQANLSPKYYIPNYSSNSNLNVPTTDMHSNMLSNLSTNLPSNLTTNPTSSISSSIAPTIENDITSDTISHLPSTSSNGPSIASLLSSPGSSNNQMNLDIPTDHESSQQPSQGTEAEMNVKAYGCGVSGCELTFTNANGLYYHMKAAHPSVIGSDKPYRCAWVGCAKKYKNINGLSYHLDTAKGSSGHKYDTEEGINEVVDKPYKCPVAGCKNRYLTANGLQYHERSIHGKDPDKYRGPHKANSKNNQGLQINQRFNDSNPQTSSNMEIDNNATSAQQQWMGNDAFRSSNLHETNPNEQNQALPMFNDNPIDVTNMLDISSSQFNDPQNQNGQNISINTLLSISSTTPKYKCCHKGCKLVFTSTNDLDRHTNNDHNNVHPNSHPSMRQFKGKPVKR